MRLVMFLCVAVFGCSSSESSPSTPVDAGATDSVVADAELVGTKCGAPPYVKWSGQVTFKEASGTGPAVGAKLTSESCPGQTLTIGADGKFDLLLTKGVKSIGRVEKEGALKNMLGEWAPESDQTDINLVLLPNLFAALIPDWDPSTEPAVVLQMEVVKGTTGACADPSGVSFTVTGQPTAKISYYDEGAIPTVMDGATATGKSGVVAFTNVTGTSIEIVGTKAGCKVSTKTRLQSGRVALAPQYLTTMVAEMQN